MKHSLSILLVLAAIMSSNPAMSEVLTGNCGTNAIYTLDTESGQLKIEGSGEMWNFIASSSPWSSERDLIRSVEISGTITNIGDYAFGDCSCLASVSIPNTVKNLGKATFSGCSSLTSFVIPDSVTSIGFALFAKCSSLASVSIPSSVTSIDGNSFWGCSALTFISIPESVTSIGQYAFRECSSLTSVDLGNSIATIGNDAFSNCSALMSITIPNSLINIGNRIFSGCSSLSSVTIGKSVESIASSAFDGCSNVKSLIYADGCTSVLQTRLTSITSVSIPGSVMSIGNAAFSDCVSLTSVYIPQSVTSIGVAAFYGCSSLTSANIPNSVKDIGARAFYGCSVLPSVSIPNFVASIGDSAFEGCSSLTSVTIGTSVTSIGRRAFLKCENLTSIIIPNSVVSIGSNAFAGCSSLVSATIGDSVISIEDWTFSDCLSLTSVFTPNSIESVGNGAFYGCSSLRSFTFGSAIKSIGNRAFIGCSSLDHITCEAVTPPMVSFDTFFEIPTWKGTLYVPSESIDAYKNADGWKAWGTIKAIDKEEVKIAIIRFAEENKEIMEGTGGRFVVEILPANATNKAMQWVSTNVAVLTVDCEGFFTAKSVGTATIMAISQDGSGKSAVCNVTVVPSSFAIVDSVSSFSVTEERTYGVLTYARSYNGEWEPLYVPFCIDVEALNEDCQLAEIVGVNQLDENKDGRPDYTILEISIMESGITEPNIPYLIRNRYAGNQVMAFKGVPVYPTEINSLDCSSVQMKYTFMGSYEARPISDIYTIQDGVLQQSDSTAPFRWYMTASNRKDSSFELPARIKIMTVEDVIDGVNNLISAPTRAGSEMYDLLGRRIAKPVRSIYIQDGRKVTRK